MKATLLKSGLLRGAANLYKMEPELNGHEFVVVSPIESAFDTGQAETYIFPANLMGDVTDWGELTGSQRGVCDPMAVLMDLGYGVE